MALTTEQKLEQAREALHQLLIGKQTVSLSFGGRAATYSKSDIEQLRAYIRELEAELDPAGARRPFGVVW